MAAIYVFANNVRKSQSLPSLENVGFYLKIELVPEDKKVVIHS